MSRVTVLPSDSETGGHYGRIKANLKERGRPIPDNDIWIAALAIQHGLVLVTEDRHFDDVKQLNLIAW